MNKNNSSCQIKPLRCVSFLAISIAAWKTEKVQARRGWREDEVRQEPKVSLIPLSISKFLIFIPFTAASTLACWHGWCYFSFCKGNRFGLMQAGGGENRSNLPGLRDSVTISQTSISACEVLSLLLIVSLFSFPLVFPDVLPLLE